jgi:hypothetical protein
MPTLTSSCCRNPNLSLFRQLLFWSSWSQDRRRCMDGHLDWTTEGSGIVSKQTDKIIIQKLDDRAVFGRWFLIVQTPICSFLNVRMFWLLRHVGGFVLWDREQFIEISLSKKKKKKSE